MQNRISRRLLLAAAALSFAAHVAAAATSDRALQAAIGDPGRTASFVARDSVRHPYEELTFFGITPKLTVVELTPGGGYWTEILSPYLSRGGGTFYAALDVPGSGEDGILKKWHERMAAQKGRLGTIHETMLGAGHYDIAPAGSADLVLTFRNLHNWMDSGYADEALRAAFTALKPGGIFGMEEHRGRDDKPQDPKAKDGYVRQDYAIALAKKAGFVLVASSEMDANAKDTKDYPSGVWALPPTLYDGAKDRDKYLAIGEADNFVLKFQKPQR